MSFWGVEIKPAKPFTLPQGRIQITQATLGTPGVLTKRSVVQCNIGDKSPVLICALLPETSESLALNLQFDEEDEVTFSVLGPRSVHLTGLYFGSGSGKRERDDDDSDSYGQDIADTDNEDDQSADIVDDGEFDDFIDDGDTEMMPPSKGHKSAVAIEDTDDVGKPLNRKGGRRRLKKKYQLNDSGVDDEEELVIKDQARCKAPENEDEDTVSISHIINKKDTAESKEVANCIEIQLAKESREGNGSNDPGTCQKLNQEGNVQVSIAEQTSEPPKDSSTPSTDIGQESNLKAKKKKKRSRGEDGDAKSEHMDIEGQLTDKTTNSAGHVTYQDNGELKKKKKKINRSLGEDGAKTKTIIQDCTGDANEEEQPSDKLFEPSKDSSMPSSDVGLESDVMPKKKKRRIIRGGDGDAKSENMDLDHVAVKPEEVQPTGKLEITPKKKHRRNHGGNGDAKSKNLDENLVGVEPEEEQPTDKTTNSVGDVTGQDNGELKKKKKKKKTQKSSQTQSETQQMV
ncbi:peptidyl-prolyl cis-trans isomerase FKBP43-like isoform X1 [Papaver somniferum]|uniref:peptidyl-prolyl cis-trans isomerase FKBP43-like isoform X1 n=1 Tax=Papaver somniferum TaxID=3469 RepID=UPI000E6FEE21|nr:peptidyl-prolyl cis-trans isomerase FKBP43-like isoform X1 [Papaver somniferum]